MADLSQASTATENILVGVQRIGGQPIPEDADADLAFVPDALNREPLSGEWIEASWSTISGSVFATVLVGPGPGGVTLAAGTYDVWIRINDGPSSVVRRSGSLQIGT